MQEKNKKTIFQKLEHFVYKIFKTSLEVFFEVLKLSPNAQGYVSGSVTELLVKKHLESLHYPVKRIKEKWEGKKHPHHYGDFYFKRRESWFVLESKGLKSNYEKWHKLYNYDRLKTFLFKEYKKIKWIKPEVGIESQIEKYIQYHLPKFLGEYKNPLYDYEEIIKYRFSERETQKSKNIQKLKKYSRTAINEMIKDRLTYIEKKFRVLETHFVSSFSKLSGRLQATPRKDEFNILSVDIFLKFNQHKFLFANPKNLDSSGSNPNHLQQNYIIGFIFEEDELHLSDEWSFDLNLVLKTLKDEEAILEQDMQIDNRELIYNEGR